jgi:hypothetical protein
LGWPGEWLPITSGHSYPVSIKCLTYHRQSWRSRHGARVRTGSRAPAATEVGKGERSPGRERGGHGTCLTALAGGGGWLHGWGGGRWSARSRESSGRDVPRAYEVVRRVGSFQAIPSVRLQNPGRARHTRGTKASESFLIPPFNSITTPNVGKRVRNSRLPIPAQFFNIQTQCKTFFCVYFGAP